MIGRRSVSRSIGVPCWVPEVKETAHGAGRQERRTPPAKFGEGWFEACHLGGAGDLNLDRDPFRLQADEALVEPDQPRELTGKPARAASLALWKVALNRARLSRSGHQRTQ